MLLRSSLVRHTSAAIHGCKLICIIVSGGFATVHPNNKLTVNVIEAAPLDAFSAEVGLDPTSTYLYQYSRHPFSFPS